MVGYLWISVLLAGSCVVAVDFPNRQDIEAALSYSIMFYEVQRSGELPENNRISWRDHSAMDDGSDVGRDLTGGWYDAGDHVKFGFPMASSVTVLAWGLVEYAESYEAIGELEIMYNSIKWPLDYFLKCIDGDEFYGQVGDAHIDHQHWTRPEDMDMERPAFKVTPSAPGSDLLAETAAAMAAASIAFSSYDEDYAEELLDAAEHLFDLADRYRGRYTDSITVAQPFYPSTNYDDELVWGALWLYRATGNQSYLDFAWSLYNQLSLWPWAFSWDDKTAGVHLLMYQLTGDGQARNNIENFLTSWFPGGSVHYTPLGLAWRDEWGSLRYSANTAFLAIVAAKEGVLAEQGIDFASSQMNYMVQSTGRTFVVGGGVNPPERPHHCAASCPTDHNIPCGWDDFHRDDANPNVIYGALVGGPDSNDYYEDDRESYVFNEVTCDYNAGFQSALAGVIDLYLRAV